MTFWIWQSLRARCTGLRRGLVAVLCGVAMTVAATPTRANEVDNVRLWAAPDRVRLVFDMASALLEACAKRGHVTTAAAESLRHSFVRDHCRG